MDLQARKLSVIEYLKSLQDETIFGKIESFLQDISKKENNAVFSKEQLIERAKISETDYKAGRVISQEDLEILSENW